MTYLASLLARATATTKAVAPTPPARHLTVRGDAARWEPPDATQAIRQANLYANLSWMQSAVDIKANYVATTPFQVYRRTTKGREPVRNHPFELRLERPNDRDSTFEFLHDTSCWIDVTGECYWWRNRANETSPDEELWIIPSGQIVPVPDGNGSVRGYLYDPGDGKPIPLEPWEVVQFKTWNPLDRYRGLSAVQALALGAQGDIAAQRHQFAFYDRDNAKPDGLLLFADSIDPARWQRLQEDMRDQTGGTKRRRMMMLQNVGPGGVQWIMTHVSQADRQYLENRTFTKEEIFGRLAPGLASVLAINATEANATAGMNTFLGMAVFPRNTAIAQKITNTILVDGEIAEFDDVRQTDTATEIKELQAAAAVMTVNEVRERYYNLPPIGDERGAMLVAAAQTPAPAPTPAPDALAVAGKALDRRRWRDKATKAQAAGRNPDVPFSPEWLDEDEAMSIRGALRRGDVAGAFGEG